MIHELILAGILGFLCLAVIVSNYRKTHPRLFFQPIVIISLVYLIYCVIGPSFRIFTGQTSYLQLDMSPFYFEGFIAALISYISILFGYKLRIGVLIAKAIPSVGKNDLSGCNLWILGWILLALGLVGLVTFTAISGASLGAYFYANLFTGNAPSSKVWTGQGYFFMELICLFIPGYISLLLSGRMSNRLLILLLLPIVAVYASFGFRYRLIALAIAFASAWFLSVNEKIRLVGLAVVGIVAFVVIGFVGLTRSVDDYSSLDFTAANMGTTILYETNIFETSACTIHNVPTRFDYVSYKPFVNSIMFLIPRFIWSEKAGLAYAGIVHQSIGTDEAYGAGVAYMLFCEYYMIFGWPALILGSIAFGTLCRAFWVYFINNQGNVYTYIVYPMFLTFVFVAIHRGYMAQHVQYFFSAIILPSLIIGFLTRRRAP